MIGGSIPPRTDLSQLLRRLQGFNEFDAVIAGPALNEENSSTSNTEARSRLTRLKKNTTLQKIDLAENKLKVLTASGLRA